MLKFVEELTFLLKFSKKQLKTLKNSLFFKKVFTKIDLNSIINLQTSRSYVNDSIIQQI